MQLRMVLLVLGLCSPSLSASRHLRRVLEVPYVQFTLANGLTVILHRDTSVPVVSVNVWYHVGSANERAWPHGSCASVRASDVRGLRPCRGGRIRYAARGRRRVEQRFNRPRPHELLHRSAGERAGAALFLESDRMAYLLDTMSPERVDGQREVVKNERRQSYENRPYGMASIELDRMLWPPAHPYSWPTIGSMEDLTAASYEDIVAFFKTYYAPNNASLVIAGDIDIARTRALVESGSARCPRGPAASRRQRRRLPS